VRAAAILLLVASLGRLLHAWYDGGRLILQRQD
jgi:hypothetical protein